MQVRSFWWAEGKGRAQALRGGVLGPREGTLAFDFCVLILAGPGEPAQRGLSRRSGAWELVPGPCMWSQSLPGLGLGPPPLCQLGITLPFLPHGALRSLGRGGG